MRSSRWFFILMKVFHMLLKIVWSCKSFGAMFTFVTLTIIIMLGFCMPIQAIFSCESFMANRTLKGFLLVMHSSNMFGNIMFFGTFVVTMWTGKGFDFQMNCVNMMLLVEFIKKRVSTQWKWISKRIVTSSENIKLRTIKGNELESLYDNGFWKLLF